ncbi:U3 small nucleolar RNA-associated protein 13 [Ophidiomyces ophidiicola]|nr:U3 small nucleolar RNA-associated protein 13 [Ophidiomyces ophidiicola]KAI2185393.1 U3 small nucleolar RNA-associated protein 13 [Ophidiomyces ophidiicola]KAI2293616.1 U3 small nucleolar RNA-associated protein 13 [Ophidiomyces ophidiicola]
MSKISVKTTFDVTKTIRPIYTGGSLSLDGSGQVLASCIGEDTVLVDLETGQQLASIEGPTQGWGTNYQYIEYVWCQPYLSEFISFSIVTPLASHLAICSRSLSMRIFSLSKSSDSKLIFPKLLRSLKPHTSPVVATAVDHTGSLLATGSADGSIKIWDIKRGYATHTFHGHGGVVSALCFFETANGKEEHRKGAKRARKIGEDSDLSFIALDGATEPAEVTGGFRLASGSEDGQIRVWDLFKKKCIASLESHVSVVRSLSFSGARNSLLSAGRDKAVITWDATTWQMKRIIPVLESVEAAGYLVDGSLFYTGGENGRLRIWDPARGSEVTQEQDAASEQEGIVAIEHSTGQPFIVTVHVDQTLKFHSITPLAAFSSGMKIDSLPIIRHVAGNDDEIIDLACVGPDRSLLAMATNSEYVRIVSTKSTENTVGKPYFGADISRLEGHDDIIICIDVDWSGHWLATGAKDNSAKLWQIDPASHSYSCFATFTGHAESLGAIVLSRNPPPTDSPAFKDPLNHPPNLLITGSQDRTIKRWDTGKLKSSTAHPKATYTRKAHEKDINALDFNHNDTLFASASQDRTAKIWSLEDGCVLGILRGHKRGVWSIRFAPKEMPPINSKSSASMSRGLIATGSGDKTIKLWSLSDYSCLMTFEGHSNSVLKVIWLSPPRISGADEDLSSQGVVQVHPLVVSAAADGLVKIWSPYTGEVEATLDNHTDRVWALATPFPPSAIPNISATESPWLDFSLLSGAADSTVSFWKDTTSATLSAAILANSERIELDQQLQNFINAGAYREAITLALQLNHPARLFSLFATAIDTEYAAAPKTLSGNADIDHAIQSISMDHLYLLLLRIRDWNTNARTSRVSQRLLYALFKSYPPSTFIDLASRSNFIPSHGKGNKDAELKDVLHALAVYTERHYKRVEDLVDESYLVEWVLGEMEGMDMDIDSVGGDRSANVIAGAGDVAMIDCP